MPKIPSAFLQNSKHGEVWVFDTRIVEWRLGGKCLRKLEFGGEKVLNAGFVDFESVKECLVVVLEDRAHVYYVGKGDFSIVSFPFSVSKAFFHVNGVLLERKLEEENTVGSKSPFAATKHRFITLSDPLNLFGSLVISSNLPEQQDSKATILHFPRAWDDHVSVLHDCNAKTLYFYNCKILAPARASGSSSSSKSHNHESAPYPANSRKKSYASLAGDAASYGKTSASNKRMLSNEHGSLASSSPSVPHATNAHPNNTATLSTELTNNLRKISIMNRRSASATMGIDLDQPSQTTGPSQSHPGVDYMKRSASATLDRMGSGSALDITPSNSSQFSQELFDHAVLTKDVVLTRISQTPLSIDISPNTHVESCRFEDKEAIILHDPDSQWGKIWIFDLNSSMTESMKFKAFNNTPIALTKIIDIKWSLIRNYCIHNSKLLPGYLMLLSSSGEEITLYNPFLNLTSNPMLIPSREHERALYFSRENLVITSEKASPVNLTILPQIGAVQHCFTAIRYLCDSFTYNYILLLWQVARSSVGEKQAACADFTALKLALLSLLQLERCPVNIKAHMEHIRQSPIFNARFDGARFLPKIVMGMHLISEEYKLNLLQKQNVEILEGILYLLTTLMKWPRLWKEFYGANEKEDTSFEYKLSNRHFVHPLDEPPSILKSLYSVSDESTIPITPFITFSRLLEDGSSVDHIITPRTNKILQLFESLDAIKFSQSNLLDIMNSLNIDSYELETYPLGVFAPLKRVLKSVENHVSEVNTGSDFTLIDRPDLQKNQEVLKSVQCDTTQTRKPLQPLVSLGPKGCENSKLQGRQPRSIRTIIDDILCLTENQPSDNLSGTNINEEVGEGQVLKRNASLIFSEDRRFFDVVELLLYNIPHKLAVLINEKSYTRALKKKRLFSQILALRTFTSGIGWGAVAFSTEKPLATQKWPQPKMNLHCIFTDKTTVTVDPKECDPSLLSWGEFHGGVSSGLRISRKSTGITGSWITFTKPPELNAQHGGFLLGLGLNGHLKNLEEWHVYNYLSPKQTHTSIGLMLGMSASLRGTMDLKLTKVLSVHIVALLPHGSSDLNVNYRVQTAGLIGVGLLYQNSQHRRMSDMLFAEVSSFVSIDEEAVPDEGYRLAAGIALGLVNIGAGAKAAEAQFEKMAHAETYTSDEDDEDSEFAEFRANNGNLDPKIINGLMNIVNSVHDTEESWMPANSQIGAVVALMLIYLKTNNRTVAEKLAPSSEEINLKARPYTRPELYMYREWAHHMILWDHIASNTEWLFKGINIACALQVNTDFLPIYYCIAGRALALGLKFASSGNSEARDNILALVDKLLPLYQCPIDARLDFQLTIKAINVLLNVLLVSVSMIMSGTGDLAVFRRVKFLHETVSGKNSDLFRTPLRKRQQKRNHAEDEMSVDLTEEPEDGVQAEGNDLDEELEEEEANSTINDELESDDASDEGRRYKDEENHFGKFMATSLSLGFLFLGSGQYAFKVSKLENLAYLIMSVLPTYMCPYYLQETKHFWSMAVEYRSLLVCDSRTGASLNKVPVDVTFKSSKSSNNFSTLKMVSPCLLPDVRLIRSIKILSPDYYPVSLDFRSDEDRINFFNNGCVLYVPPREDDGNGWQQNQEAADKSCEVRQILKKKVMSLSSPSASTSKSKCTDDILKHLGLANQESLEIENEVLKLKENQDPLLDENLMMSCQNQSKSYHLELWRRRHKF